MLENLPVDCMQAYSTEGEGIGADAGAIEVMEKNTLHRLQVDSRVLEIGFGAGYCILECLRRCPMGKVCGIDAAQMSLDGTLERVRVAQANENDTLTASPSLYLLDVSHHFVSWQESSFDFAFCTETIEHVANPFYMVSNVKRVLRAGGVFVLAFPSPLDNLGYGSGKHAHIYPFFLVPESFERFMMQLYFKLDFKMQNGSSMWYVYRNYKGPEMVDVFKMISGNYEGEEQQLYGCMDIF